MLNVTSQTLDDVTVFQCTGRITAEEAEMLRRAVLAHPPVGMAILDLAGITAVDAGGLGVLISLQTWCRAGGARLKLMNVRPCVEELLSLTNLSHVFEVCSTKEMLELLCRATRQPQLAGIDDEATAIPGLPA